MYKVQFSARSHKALKKIPRKQAGRILKAVQLLQTEPFLGKKLQGEYEGYYSVRVWPYRVVYEIRKKKLIIFVIDIGHRQGIYS